MEIKGINSFAELQRLVMEGDARVMYWLVHEKGRLQTFKKWPHAKPGKSCMAFAGFYYTNEEDIAQCVYCQGAIRGWMSADDPLQVHKMFFPHCPLASGRPIMNFGDTERIYCCPSHPESMKLYKRRLTTPYNSSGLGTYITALLILLCGIGITPVALATSVQDTLSPVSTWKGLVGTKQQEVLIPTKTATYYWPIDLKVCKEAENGLLAAVRAHKLALNAVTTGVESDLKNPALTLLDFLQTKLNNGISKMLSNNLPAVDPNNLTKQTCTPPAAITPDQTVCNVLKTSAKALENSFQSSTDSKTLAGTVSVIAERVNSFQSHVNSLRNLWAQIKAGLLQTKAIAPFESSCATTIAEQCGAGLSEEEQGKLHSLAKLTGISKSGTDELQLWLQFTAPCTSDRQKMAKYRLHALPYKEANQFKVLQLPYTETWVSRSNSNELNMAPLTCSKYEVTAADAGELSVCRTTEDPEEKGWIQGSTSDLKLRSKELVSTPEITILDTNANEYLIHAPEKIQGNYKCGSQNAETVEIKDLVKFSPQDGCTLEIAGQKPLSYNAMETRVSSEFPEKLTISKGNLLAYERKAPGRLDQVGVLRRGVTHIQTYWMVYLGATGGSTLLVLTCCGCLFIRAETKRREVHALHADREEQTYVVERSRRV
jgi:hypothetical protein